MSGKSTTINALERDLDLKAVFVQEAATITLERGFRPRPNIDTASAEDIRAWGMGFQTEVYRVQAELEATAQARAHELGIALRVFDRCKYDGAIYYPGGHNAFCDTFALSLEQMNDDFTMVIFLESLAVGQPHLFGTGNNAHRYETDADEALDVNRRTLELYQNHPNFHFLSAHLGLREKIRTTHKLILEL